MNPTDFLNVGAGGGLAINPSSSATSGNTANALKFGAYNDNSLVKWGLSIAGVLALVYMVRK